MIYDVVIVGGGISGLVAAYKLTKKGKNVLLLEKGNAVGGNIRTIHDGDYLLELGPNTLRNEYPELETLINELGLMQQVQAPLASAKKSYIALGKKLHPLPTSVWSAISSPLLSIGAKLGVLKEPFIKKQTEEESVAAFFERKFGKEIVDNLVAPMVSGIFAGDVNQLSMSAAFPKIHAIEMKFGSLTKGLFQGRKKEIKNSSSLPKIFSFKDGLDALPQALANEIEGNIKLGVSCQEIRKEDSHFIIETLDESFEAKNVILSTPARVTADLIANLDDQLSKRLFSIKYPPMVIVHLAYKREYIKHFLDGFGFLVAPSEKSKILGCIFTSAFLADSAPRDEALLTVMIGGATGTDILNRSDEDILDTAHNEVSCYLGISSMPTYSYITRLPHAIPQYNIGHQQIIDEIERVEKENPGLHFLANYRGGISVGSCIKNAFDLAERL